MPDEAACRLVRRGDCGSRTDVMSQRLMRRSGRTFGVATAADGATSRHSAQGLPRDAGGAWRSTRRQPTGAPSGDARQGRATDAQETPRTDPQETLRGKMEVEEEHESAPEEAMEE